tara:strand:- start:236 stop:403 length:168 start_codon:yes stop_codon:yes gene_type:complete
MMCNNCGDKPAKFNIQDILIIYAIDEKGNTSIDDSTHIGDVNDFLCAECHEGDEQ